MVSDGLHNSTVLLEIRLKDVNDRNPVFNSSIQYSASVAEVGFLLGNKLFFMFQWRLVLLRIPYELMISKIYKEARYGHTTFYPKPIEVKSVGKLP